MTMEALPVHWTPSARIAFRFAMAYLGLYCVPGLLYFLPKGEWLTERYMWPWDQVVPAVAETMFGLDAQRVQTGSGDTAYDFVLSFCYLGLAAVATAVWTVLDRGRVAYPRLLDGLRSLVRLVLGATMLVYGLSKVTYMQFGFPEGEQLLKRYGDGSPMNLLWTFMGYSYAYCAFTGALECLGGLLLLWRRTTTLGALVVMGVMANVVALNVCYDVPVKLYSMHLLAMAVWLALPDLRRLADFFFLQRAVEAPRPRVDTGARWIERARLPVKVIVLLWLAYALVIDQVEGYREWGLGRPRPALAATYVVERPALPTDATEWKRVTITPFELAIVTYRDDHQQRFQVAIDEQASTLTLTPITKTGPGTPVVLHYTRPDADHLALTGPGGLAMQTKVLRPSSFLLVNRGFRWIQEYPFNR